MNAIISISTPLRSVTNLPFGPTSFFFKGSKYFTILYSVKFKAIFKHINMKKEL